ncbi:four helix bundle protein [Mangrovibacterium lignilyticum]|uniref:four helix bundle protein n=1 Tax=Mangrovibacterium lignilyticum TaxID=2668052 RepID=UPI0013D7E8F2|nr:four helix bundle protein [Mangrovibacterium lignilyticum]
MATPDQINFRNEQKTRLRTFFLNLLKMTQQIPYSQESKTIKGQLIRSGSSVYSNYRAACRARSKNEFFSKLSIVVEEADETEMWLDLLILSSISTNDQAKTLHSESLEILKIMATARKNSN